MRILRKFIWIFSVLGFIAGTLGAQSISARFNPEIIAVGEVGTYEVSLDNFDLNSLPSVNPPNVRGLQVLDQNPSTSRSTSIMNGRVSSQFSLTWQVAAAKEGTYTVPAQSIVVNRKSYTIPAKTIRVIPVNQKEIGLFRLNWDLSQKTCYVGEAIPVLLKLYVRADLRGNPQNLSIRLDDGLVSSPDHDPEVVREQIDGVTYNVVYWSRLLTPIRPDTYSLFASIEMLYEDPSGSRRSTDFFFRQVATLRKLIVAPEETLAVQEVPKIGRLEGFNGAVGNFESSVKLKKDTVQAGEPVTLTLTLSGSGNFDRVAAPEIAENPQWRVYPPKVSFSPSDSIGFQGTKTFEYLLIPTDESVVATPSIKWAAFDPYRGAFSDLSIASLPVTVTPAPEATATLNFATGIPGILQPARSESWRPFHADLGRLVPGVRPILRQPIFWLVQGIAGLFAAAIWFWRWRQERLVSDESYARRVSSSKTVRHWLKEAETKATEGNAEAFFAAAQRTVQEAVGRHFTGSHKAESLTLSEIEAQLVKLGTEEKHRTEVTNLFQAGDALRYAGLSQEANALNEHQKRLEDLIRAIR